MNNKSVGEKNVPLSVCIITKNEEENLNRCLECLSSFDFEIVVVDTGSVDATKEIAARYTNHIYDFKWCNDFATAKNFAVSKATNEYVMVIDSDEYLQQADLEQISLEIQRNPDKVGRIRRRNIFTENQSKEEYDEWINRIFSKEKYHYTGRIHEQVTAIDGSEYDTYKAGVEILHSGYDLPEEKKKEKAARNIALLEKEVERLNASQTGENERLEQLPYMLYQLGKSYYMTADYVLACDYFSQGLSFDLNPKQEYVMDMVETYGYALINSGRAEEALFFQNIYEEFANSADFVFLMGLIYMNNECFGAAIEEFKKATGYTECKSKGVNSYCAWYNIGVIYECLGYVEEAKVYYLRCMDYKPARERLRYLKQTQE